MGGGGREVIVCFVDVAVIVDHHCLNFLFITKTRNVVDKIVNMSK